MDGAIQRLQSALEVTLQLVGGGQVAQESRGRSWLLLNGAFQALDSMGSITQFQQLKCSLVKVFGLSDWASQHLAVCLQRSFGISRLGEHLSQANQQVDAFRIELHSAGEGGNSFFACAKDQGLISKPGEHGDIVWSQLNSDASSL